MKGNLAGIAKMTGWLLAIVTVLSVVLLFATDLIGDYLLDLLIIAAMSFAVYDLLKKYKESKNKKQAILAIAIVGFILIYLMYLGLKLLAS